MMSFSFILSSVFLKKSALSSSDSLTVFSQFSLSSQIFLIASYTQSVLSVASFRAAVFSSAVSLSDSILITSCVVRSLPSDFKDCYSFAISLPLQSRQLTLKAFTLLLGVIIFSISCLLPWLHFSLLIIILFEILGLFKNFLEDFFVPFRRVTILIK